jgi:superfamily II DNA or RNA helicase
MEKATKVKYRFGFTGTLDGMLTNQMVIEGLFGKIVSFVKTKELQDDGTLSELKIKCIILKHNDVDRKLLKGADYQKEMDFIVTNQKRNEFIINLVDHLKGPTLVLFQYVDKHGKVIHKMMQDHQSTKPTFIIHGGVEVEEREDIRALIDTGEDMVLFASYGTFQAGINAPKIRNIVFASPTKSRIRNLQSIGRGLRKAEGKDKCNLFDISDDLTTGKKINHTYRHFAERLKIYISESFEYKIVKHELKG